MVELLVVITIIGVLATLVLLQLGTARAKARDAKRIADVSQLRTAVELFFDDNGGDYPNGLSYASLQDYFSSPALPDDPLNPAPGSADSNYGYTFHPGAGTTTAYQIYTELERVNTAAFAADADIDSTAAGPNGVWAGGIPVDGTVEGAGNCDANTALDCVYDVGQDR